MEIQKILSRKKSGKKEPKRPKQKERKIFNKIFTKGRTIMSKKKPKQQKLSDNHVGGFVVITQPL